MSDTPQSELTELEEQITELRRDNQQLREQVGGKGFGAGDAEDTAAALTNVEENEALLASLEARRAALRGDTD